MYERMSKYIRLTENDPNIFGNEYIWLKIFEYIRIYEYSAFAITHGVNPFMLHLWQILLGASKYIPVTQSSLNEYSNIFG